LELRLLLIAFAAGFLTRANISRRRRAAVRHLRGDAWGHFSLPGMAGL